MIHKLRAWWLHRKAVKSETLFNAGFDYAAGELLRGRNDKTVVDRLYYESFNPFDKTNFDVGMRAALVSFARMRADDRASRRVQPWRVE